MEPDISTDTVVRPVRVTDAEALGRVHATCWHETYDHLISTAALENVSHRRMAELWAHWIDQGPDYTQAAALVGGEIVGFAGSGPARDEDAPQERELYFIYLLSAWHGTGIGQQLFDAVIDKDQPSYLWVAEDNPRAHGFYTRNGYQLDGGAQVEQFLGESITEVRFVR